MAFFLKIISLFFDHLVVWIENPTKGRTSHVSEKLDLEEYNKPEFFDKPELFYVRGLKMPEVEVTPRHTFGGVRVSHIKFRSETETGVAENDTVVGRMFESRAGGEAAPCVIALHGWRENGAFTLHYFLVGWLLARFGINVIFLSQPYHGPRAPRGSAHGELMLSGDMEKTVLAFQQSVGDVRSAVTWALERFNGPHGGGPVGVMGFSLGGFVTLLTACVDERIKFAVPIIASGELVRGVWKRPIGKTLVRDFERAGLTEERVRENWQIISPIYLRPKLPVDRIQLIAARYDTMIPAENVKALWEAWGRPRIRWLPCGHVSLFLFPREFIRAIVRFCSIIMLNINNLLSY